MSRFERLQASYWNKQSCSYSRLNRNHLKKVRMISEVLGFKPRQRVLEVGVGTGVHAEFVLSHHRLRFSGVDISSGMIEAAKSRLGRFKNVDLRVASAERLPFPDNYFDGVFCSATLHHLRSPFQGLQEMFRVLRPGGRLVVVEPNILFPKNLLQALFIKEERNNLLLTKKNLISWAKKLGLKPYRLGYFMFSLPFPKFLFLFYDWLDSTFYKIPFLKNFAIQIYLSGRK